MEKKKFQAVIRDEQVWNGLKQVHNKLLDIKNAGLKQTKKFKLISGEEILAELIANYMLCCKKGGN